jgi:uncharacterized protein YdaU (DUF1376 family)
MHYYKRNIGDYAKKAGRLTMLQHGSYTLLIDSCYDRETFPTLEQALEWTWASTEAEVEAVKFVLSRFFKLDKDGCYVQDRVLEELLNYHKNADTNKRIADEREAKRRENKTKREQSVDEPPPNHEPLTNNHKPIKERATSVACPHDVSPQVWQDWLQLRKSKKASVTETVVKGARAEAGKLNWTLDQFLIEWCTRGSQGLKAEWVVEKQTATQKAAANMNLLTRGMSGPKPAPFWAKTENLEVIHEEPKRLV